MSEQWVTSAYAAPNDADRRNCPLTSTLASFFYQGTWLLLLFCLRRTRRSLRIGNTIIKTSSPILYHQSFLLLLEYPTPRAKYSYNVSCSSQRSALHRASSVITGYDRHCCYLFPFPHFSSPFLSSATKYLRFAKQDNASHSCFRLVFYYISRNQHGAAVNRAIVHSEKRDSSFQPRLKSMVPLVTHGLESVPGIRI